MTSGMRGTGSFPNTFKNIVMQNGNQQMVKMTMTTNSDVVSRNSSRRRLSRRFLAASRAYPPELITLDLSGDVARLSMSLTVYWIAFASLRLDESPLANNARSFPIRFARLGVSKTSRGVLGADKVSVRAVCELLLLSLECAGVSAVGELIRLDRF